MFAATAFDPVREYQVCPKRTSYVAKGSRALGPEDGNGVLVGKGISEALALKPGETVVMQAAGERGNVNALDLSLVGFLPSLHPAESKRLATVELRFAQELLRMKGRVTGYVLGVVELKNVDEVAARVRGALGEGYEVTTWKESDPLSLNRTRMFQAIFGFVALILCLLVATGIMNTSLMSVHERVREIGTMMAVGVRRAQISVLFLWEAVLLALASASVGAGLGLAVIAFFARNGVLGGAPGGEQALIYPHVGPFFLAGVMVFTVVGAVLSAVYPAWKASRLRPVEALRAT
jgi:putative ABC transport system permease protein